MHRTMGTTTRRLLLQGGLLAALALVASRGALPIPDVAAEKKTEKKRNSVQSCNQSQTDGCETGGGTIEVTNVGGGSWETSCHGGDWDGYECTNTPKSTVCVQTRTDPDLPGQTDPGDAPDHPLEPDPPIADPGDTPTHPLEPSDPPHADPGDVPTHPLEPDGGGVTITAYNGDTRDQAKHRGTRHRQGHGKGRKG